MLLFSILSFVVTQLINLALHFFGPKTDVRRLQPVKQDEFFMPSPKEINFDFSFSSSFYDRLHSYMNSYDDSLESSSDNPKFPIFNITKDLKPKSRINVLHKNVHWPYYTRSGRKSMIGNFQDADDTNRGCGMINFADSAFCTRRTADFPYKVIGKVIEDTNFDTRVLNLYSLATDDVSTNGELNSLLDIPEQKDTFCQSIKKVLYPVKGQTESGEWYYILLGQSGVSIELCLSNQTCSIIQGLKTKCVQQSTVRTFYVLDDKGKTKSIREMKFKIPSYCMCTILKTENSSNDKLNQIVSSRQPNNVPSSSKELVVFIPKNGARKLKHRKVKKNRKHMKKTTEFVTTTKFSTTTKLSTTTEFSTTTTLATNKTTTLKSKGKPRQRKSKKRHPRNVSPLLEIESSTVSMITTENPYTNNDTFLLEQPIKDIISINVEIPSLNRTSRDVKVIITKQTECIKFGNTICTNVQNYPQNYIRNVINLSEYRNSSLFNSEIEKEVEASNKLGTGENRLCPTKSKVIYPQAYKNKKNEWKYVLQDPRRKLLQGFRIEECSLEGCQCNFADNFPSGYKSICKQKFKYRMIITVDKYGNVERDFTEVPSFCVCDVYKIDL